MSEKESSLTEHTQSRTRAMKMPLDFAPGEASGRAPCLQFPMLVLAGDNCWTTQNLVQITSIFASSEKH